MIGNQDKALSAEKDLVEIAIDYVWREQSAKEIADSRGVSSKTILRRLRVLGIPVRSTAEQRHCDRRRGKHSQSEAVKAAWRRGAYDTETFRNRIIGTYDKRGRKNPFYGRTHSPKTRTQISSRARARCRPGIGTYGDDWTQELRDRIVARDLFRCAICGSAQGMLQVHHVDLDRTNNDEANLLTLCAACHLAYHGRGELELELEEAHIRLLQRLTADPGVGTGDDQWA